MLQTTSKLFIITNYIQYIIYIIYIQRRKTSQFTCKHPSLNLMHFETSHFHLTVITYFPVATLTVNYASQSISQKRRSIRLVLNFINWPTVKPTKKARACSKIYSSSWVEDITRVLCEQDKWEGSDSSGRPYDVTFTYLARERHIEGKGFWVSIVKACSHLHESLFLRISP